MGIRVLGSGEGFVRGEEGERRWSWVRDDARKLLEARENQNAILRLARSRLSSTASVTGVSKCRAEGQTLTLIGR